VYVCVAVHFTPHIVSQGEMQGKGPESRKGGLLLFTSKSLSLATWTYKVRCGV